jgi:ribosomal protein S18 acetylase RimI-like enzyme
MTKIEYDEYLNQSIQGYANELITSGIVEQDKAMQQSKSTFESLLPKGINTENHYLYYAYDQDVRVGFIWYGFRNQHDAFIFDFFIDESMRRKGYGKKVLKACEDDAKNKGAKTIGLHVFGHNKAARALYESIGYVATSIQMRKDL